MLCVLAASCLSCRKQVERIEYLPNYHQMYLFQNKSSSDYVLFRIYSSGPGGRAEDGFFVGKGYKDDSYHDVYSFDGANPFYLLPDATENYTTISNGKVYVVQRPGDAGSVYDDAFCRFLNTLPFRACGAYMRNLSDFEIDNCIITRYIFVNSLVEARLYRRVACFYTSVNTLG